MSKRVAKRGSVDDVGAKRSLCGDNESMNKNSKADQGSKKMGCAIYSSYQNSDDNLKNYKEKVLETKTVCSYYPHVWSI